MECKAGLTPKALLLHTIHDTRKTMWVTSHASSLQGNSRNFCYANIPVPRPKGNQIFLLQDLLGLLPLSAH